MKRIIIKITISIAIGLIVGQLAGNINSKRIYFVVDSSLTKKEVTKELWESYYEHMKLEPEDVFNASSYYTYGIISMCSLAVVLLAGELRKTE